MIIKKRVKETERSIWEASMQTKSESEMCRLFKGSNLLFEARTGLLLTKTYKASYQDMDSACGACGEEEEVAEHLILGKGFTLQRLEARLIW